MHNKLHNSIAAYEIQKFYISLLAQTGDPHNFSSIIFLWSLCSCFYFEDEIHQQEIVVLLIAVDLMWIFLLNFLAASEPNVLVRHCVIVRRLFLFQFNPIFHANTPGMTSRYYRTSKQIQNQFTYLQTCRGPW